ncbi:hypothetical protein [Nonomuraea sp. NPDC023979]|uniref:hypothetical protein n=1 Tax=Nonomuraea sp. NPDC023979 TaxID=3154796 RepID=UPI0033ECD82D
MTRAAKTDDVPPVATVGELTEQHLGWRVRVPDTNPTIARRYLDLIDVRHWEYKETAYSGLTSTEGQDRGWAGTEHTYPSSTPCELVQKVKVKPLRRTPRRRKS